jgi:energy-coupling factor transporter transmembrane protein EcfT
MWNKELPNGGVVLIGAVILTTGGFYFDNIISLLLLSLFSLLINKIFLKNILLSKNQLKNYLILFIGMSVTQSIFRNQNYEYLSFLKLCLIGDVGLKYGIRIILKFMLLFFSVKMLYFVRPGKMISNLKVFKIAHEVRLLTVMGLFKIPEMRKKFISIRNAFEIRNIRIKDQKFSKKLQIIEGHLFPMLLYLDNIADDIEINLEVKKYNRDLKRSDFFSSKWGFKEIAYLISIIIFVLIIILLNRYGGDINESFFNNWNI